MKIALITGAGGFFAAHLAEALARRGDCRIVGLDLPSAAPVRRALDEYLAADLADPVQAEQIIQQIQPDLVFHLAGRIRGNPDDLYRANLMAGVCLLEAVRLRKPDTRVIVTGSAAEYGKVPEDAPVREDHPCNPSGAYALSKYALTLASMDAAHRDGMKVVVVRPFNLIGSGVPASLVVGAVLARLKAALASPGEAIVTVGNLDTQRDFIAVEDAAQAYLALIQGERWGEIFNICSGVPTTIRSVLETLLSFSPRQVRLVTDLGLARPFESPVVYGSWEKASSAFGFRPTTPLKLALFSAWKSSIGSVE